jgi:hypothetical protein
MPDQFGFDHLGATVRCIDRPTGGPSGRWPEAKRSRHVRTHCAPHRAALGRRRNLLAAPPTYSNEENKEAITMANTARTKNESAKAVTLDLLRKAGEPLAAKEIAKRVISSGRCTSLKGKTPEATISAMLAVGSKPGGPFKRVAKGTYTLADATPTGSEKPTPRPRRGGKPATTKPAPQTAKAGNGEGKA